MIHFSQYKEAVRSGFSGSGRVRGDSPPQNLPLIMGEYVMSRKKVKKSSPYLDLSKGFTAFPNSTIKSDQWRGLSRAAKIAYFNILASYRIGGDNEIVCPRDTLPWSMHSNTWLNGTKELASKGFIKVIRRSGIGHYPNKYFLSNEWKKKVSVH